MLNVEADNEILLLDNGVWYNPYHDCFNGSAVLNESIEVIKMQLEYLKSRNHNLTIFWLGNPPTVESFNAPDDIVKYYAFDEFATRDEFVMSVLQPIGVIFLDVIHFSKEIKAHCPSIAHDYLHWSNPGSFSIPSFLLERMLHLYVLQFL